MPIICTADNSTHETSEKLRLHLRRWLVANPERGKTWAIDYLHQRKIDKGLIYAPSQAELRSLYCPTMPYYDMLGGYYSITRELGFLDRYSAESPRFIPLMADVRFVTDSREQNPLMVPYSTTAKLDFGDYALAPPYNRGIHVERKSLADFVGTMSGKKTEHKRIDTDSPCERFERELIRAKEAGGYIVMLVEADVKDALTFRKRLDMKWGKATESHIFKNMRDLLVKYPLTWQAVFVFGRDTALTKMLRIFEMGEQVKLIDLQNAYEKGEL